MTYLLVICVGIAFNMLVWGYLGYRAGYRLGKRQAIATWQQPTQRVPDSGLGMLQQILGPDFGKAAGSKENK